MKEKYLFTAVALLPAGKNHFGTHSPTGAFNLKNRFLLLATFIIAFATAGFAQTAANYGFAVSTGTYTPITVAGGATAPSTAYGDDVLFNITGLTAFNYNGTNYTNYQFNSNGRVVLYGATAPGSGTASNYLPLSTSINNAGLVIAPFGCDLTISSAATSAWLYQTIGNEIIFQWDNVSRYSLSGSNDILNIQLRLNTSTGSITYVYGSCTVGSNPTGVPQVGFRTGSATIWSTDVNNLMLDATGSPSTCTWSNPVTGNANNSNVRFSGTMIPSSGLTYTWTKQSAVNTVRTFTAVSGIAPTSATINWTAPTGATGYNVQYRTLTSCAWTTWAGAVTTNSVTLTGLSETTAYQVRVQATNGANAATYSHTPNQAGGGNGYNATGTFTTTTSSPVLTAGTISGAFGSVCLNTDSAIRNFTLSGSNLTSANVTVGPLTGYTFSAASAGTYTTTLTIPTASGNVTISPVYVKLTPTAVQSYSGSIPVSGGGATATSVAVTGAGVNSAPTITAAGTAGSTTATTTTISGSAVTAGCTATTVYGIEYSTSATFTSGTGTQVASTNLAGGVYSTNLSGLSSGNTYYYRAYATNSGGTTYFPSGTPSSFSTVCGSTAVPYAQNFESVTTPALPACTTIQNAGSGNNWITSTGSYNAPAGKVLQYTYNSSNAANAWFYTQGLSLTGGTSYRLTYKYNTASGFTEKLKVAYGTSAVAASMTTQLADYPSLTSATQTTATIDFTPATTAVYYIGFNAYSAANQFNLYLDDIAVDLSPTCAPPTALTATNVYPYQASFTWTAPTFTTPGSYDYEVRTSGTPGTAGAVATGSVSAPVVTATATGLLPNTLYSVYVRSHCSGSDYSVWTAATTFTTQPVATVTWAEPFTAASLPTGWVNGTPAWTVGAANTAITGASGNYISRLLNGTNTTSSFTTINVGPLTTNNRLKFDYKVALTDGSVAAADTGGFTVEISTDYGQTWTSLASVSNNSSALWQTKIYSLASYATQVVKFRITATRTSSNPNFAFDNFVIEPTPACDLPTAVTAVALGTTTATINWSGPSSAPVNGYEYYFATTSTPAPVDPESPALAATETVNLTGLTSGQQYYFWVRSLCDGVTSAWAGPSTFTTSKLEPTNYVTNFAVSAVTGAQVTFTWTAATGTVAPDGYKLTGSTTDPAATPVDGTDAANANLGTASPVIKVAGGAVTTGALAGGTAGTMYYFKNVPYTNTGTAIDYKTDGTIPALNYATKPAVVTATAGTATSGASATISWSLPATFDPARHTVLVFVKQGTTAVTAGTPTADPSTYVPSNTFGLGTVYQGDALAYNVYNGTGTSVTVTGLTANTAYNVGFAVVMKAANYNSTYTYSNGAAASYSTPCDAVTSLPWTENFDGMTALGSAVVPVCWTNITGTKAWASANAATTTYNVPKTTPNYMNIAWSNTVASSLWTPGFALTAGTNYNFSFYYNTNGTTASFMGFTGDVLANTSASATGASTLGTFITSTVGTAGYTLYTVTFTPATTATYYFGLSVTSTGTPWYLGVDDFKLDLTPVCASPVAGLAATSVTSASATIGWTAPASVPSGGYEYFYSTVNTAPSDAASVVPANVVTTNSAALSSLTSSTPYYWWVRSICDSGLTGTWSSGGTFTTPQTPAALDYTEDFEGVVNWIFANGTQTNKWVVGAATSNGGANALYISNDNGVTNAYSIGSSSKAHAYRDVAVPTGTTNLVLSFDWKANGEYDGDYYDYLRVWAVPTTYTPVAGTTIASGSGNIQIGTYFLLQPAFTTYINAFDASTFAGGTMRLVFEWTNDSSAGTQPAAAIDNILLKVPCAATVASVTGAARCGTGSVTLSATGSATQYRWYSSSTGGSILETTAGSFTTPALTETTTYYVAAYNGTCETEIRTAVTAIVNALPVIAISSAVTPAGSDACTLDYVRLDITGNTSLPIFKENFEAATVAETGFNMAVSNGDSGVVYRETYHTSGSYGYSLVGAGDIDDTSGNVRLVQRTAINLTTYAQVTLTFDHICASEPGFDYGYVQYSIDGGSNWVDLPASSYTGTGTLKNGVVSFDASSYSDWDTQFEDEFTPGDAPATGLFKSESINLSAYATSSNFKVRFRLNYDASNDYYGWIIDNVKINGVPLVTWSPATGLYTDAALTTPYVSGNAATVYAAPSGLVTYTAAATTGFCPVTVSQAVENNHKRFVGTGNDWSASVTTDWFPAGIPTVTDCVTIPSGKSLAVTSGTAYANNLTVANGATLTVNSGATLRVEGAINSNLTTANLTVNNNGAILQAAAATTNGNTGKIVFHKNSNPLFRLDYTLWSAPITGQTLRAFSLGTSNNRFYVYDYTTPAGSSVYNEAYWPVDPITTYFEEGKGYLIRMPNLITSSVTGTTGTGTTTVAEYAAGTGNYIFDGAFAGKPNNGSYSPDLIQTTGASGYNAVGNPYPSPISVSAFLVANSGNLVSNTGIWFWRKKNGSETSYLTLNLSGLVIPPGDTNGNGTELNTALSGFYSGDNSGDTWLIAPGQGFLVQAQPTATAVSFTNLMRRATPGTQAFFRQAAGTASRYWLNMVAQNGTGSQALVAYRDDATTGIDYGYDSKVFNTSDLSLYSLATDSKLTIQARPGFEVSDVVPMGFTAPAAGQYTISIDHMDGVFADGQTIYLKDLQEGIIRNLSENDYTFTSEAGTFEGRFEVHYQTSALGTDTPVLDANSVIVFKQGNTISINTGSAIMNSVKVFDVRGRLLYSQGGINAAETVINNLHVQQEVLIVEIATEKGTVSKRIIF